MDWPAGLLVHGNHQQSTSLIIDDPTYLAAFGLSIESLLGAANLLHQEAQRALASELDLSQAINELKDAASSSSESSLRESFAILQSLSAHISQRCVELESLIVDCLKRLSVPSSRTPQRRSKRKRTDVESEELEARDDLAMIRNRREVLVLLERRLRFAVLSFIQLHVSKRYSSASSKSRLTDSQMGALKWFLSLKSPSECSVIGVSQPLALALSDLIPGPSFIEFFQRLFDGFLSSARERPSDADPRIHAAFSSELRSLFAIDHSTGASVVSSHGFRIPGFPKLEVALGDIDITLWQALNRVGFFPVIFFASRGSQTFIVVLASSIQQRLQLEASQQFDANRWNQERRVIVRDYLTLNHQQQTSALVSALGSTVDVSQMARTVASTIHAHLTPIAEHQSHPTGPLHALQSRLQQEFLSEHPSLPKNRHTAHVFFRAMIASGVRTLPSKNESNLLDQLSTTFGMSKSSIRRWWRKHANEPELDFRSAAQSISGSLAMERQLAQRRIDLTRKILCDPNHTLLESQWGNRQIHLFPNVSDLAAIDAFAVCALATNRAATAFTEAQRLKMANDGISIDI